MDRDQYLLQQRLLHERHQRQAELRAQYEAGEDAIQLDDSRYQQDNGQEDVYAAEVDDTELQDVLIAPPRKKISRRYTVQEVEASPDLRAAMPRIEIDTVHFGFNEAFVRAEEVSNLDRLAEIMERILTAHPREIFLIEGHTDAVGSDAANLVLSRQRAEAIKTALQTYYVIPGKNLRTVGYGERYLKIPTAEAEQENRRVSVSRATALIGQADE
jgi:outer membrane protein OmpA-like peptidoglycan-associated protein